VSDPSDDATAGPDGRSRVEGDVLGSEDLALRAARGDREARERLVSSCLPWLRRLARRYAGRGVELADLEQEAVIGLLRALVRFDPERGTPFWAYARWWVRQALQQAVAESSRAIRLPTHVLWDMHELKETRERLARERGREPGIIEIADALGWNAGRVEHALRAEQPARSLEEHAADLLEDPLAAETYEHVLVDLTARQLRPLLLQLSERERTILMRRAAGQSLREIGRSLGVSGQRVQTIEGRALAKVRTAASAGVDSQPRVLTSSVAGAVPAGDHLDEEER
jgi:RNA polymerase sigma factor (sigma-70 family)